MFLPHPGRGRGRLEAWRDKFARYYTNNPDAIYELPCLQVARRGGRAYLTLAGERDYLRYCNYFVAHELPTADSE